MELSLWIPDVILAVDPDCFLGDHLDSKKVNNGDNWGYYNSYRGYSPTC